MKKMHLLLEVPAGMERGRAVHPLLLPPSPSTWTFQRPPPGKQLAEKPGEDNQQGCISKEVKGKE